MPRFNYKARKENKEEVSGLIEAENANAALHRLSAMGYFPISIAQEDIEKASSAKATILPFRKISIRDLSVFTRHLSDLLEAGLPLTRALSVLERQTSAAYMENVIGSLRESVQDGNPLSVSLQRHPKVFSNLYVSMVRSGEESGSMENVLLRLAEFQESQDELNSTVRRAMAYPALMGTIGTVTIFVLMVFVIPRIVSMFEELNQALPLPTVILLKISYFLRDFWWLIAAVLAAVYFAFSRFAKTHEGKMALDSGKLRIPVIGRLIQMAEIARFSRTLSTLLNNGVPILESLAIVIETMENEYLKQEVTNAQRVVREGESLAKGLSKGSHFPVFVSNMVAIGEESGALEKSLIKVAVSYEREVDRTVKLLTSLLEPLMILIMGTIIGFIVIAMLLPIFEISFVAR